MRPGDSTQDASRRRSLALLCALLLIACVFAAQPFAEIGINDEFSYIRSAQTLAQTGHIAFYGWSSAMLGAQIALGALFIKLFGFSFTATRCAVLLIAAATAFLLQRTSVRLGLTEDNATFATLALVLSPLFLPLSFSFMTDIAALFAIVLSLYLCLRALQTEGHSLPWLVAAALSSAILGTARQTGWLGVIILVPCTVWLLRHRKLPLLPLLAVWFACLAFIAACLAWFNRQLYTTHEGVPQAGVTHNHTLEVAAALLRILLNLAFFLLPVLIAFVAPLFRQKLQQRRIAFVALPILLLGALLLLRPHSYAVKVLLAPSSAMGSYVTPRGLLDIPDIGLRPLVLAQPIRTLFTVVLFTATLSFLAFLLQRSRLTAQTSTGAISWSRLAILLGPSTAAYSLFLLLRAASDALFDRYLLPVVVLALLLVVRFYQERIAPRIPLSGYVILALYAAFAIASTHDLFAMERARVAAAEELRAAGLPRTAFYGGFGYDGWTQIDAQGYVAAGGITLPPGTPPYNEALEQFRPCGYTLAHYFPAIRAQYALSFDDTTCGEPSPFPAVPYTTWLPPKTAAMYIRKLDPTRP